MGLLSILEKGIKAMIDLAFTPESFKIGESFENYVREKIFIESIMIFLKELIIINRIIRII